MARRDLNEALTLNHAVWKTKFLRLGHIFRSAFKAQKQNRLTWPYSSYESHQGTFWNRIPNHPGGMIWCSGWELASAVSNAGGLGIIGAGSMYPEVLRDQILKCKAATDRPFAVNVPLLYPSIEEHMATIVELGVPIVFTSAGNPKTWTEHLKSQGIRVVHVVSSVKFALKAQAAGVDAIVAEGFEAGGHNGREETTTLCLVPSVVDTLDVPVIAAGGIGDARAIVAAFALGAEGVQIGSRFVTTVESSAHQAFKDEVVAAGEGGDSVESKGVDAGTVAG